MHNQKELLNVCGDFVLDSYELLGAYLDAMAGLQVLKKDVIAHQEKHLENLRKSDPINANMEFLDKAPMTHELEGQPDEAATMLHRTTLGEFKRRISVGGVTGRRLGEMMITRLYGNWEEEYRGKIATALGYNDKNDVTSDLFGDLRQLRHAIVHNRGIATTEVSEAKILKWFKRGEMILVTIEQANTLFGLVDATAGELLLQHGVGQDQIDAFVAERKKSSSNAQRS